MFFPPQEEPGNGPEEPGPGSTICTPGKQQTAERQQEENSARTGETAAGQGFPAEHVAVQDGRVRPLRFIQEPWKRWTDATHKFMCQRSGSGPGFRPMSLLCLLPPPRRASPRLPAALLLHQENGVECEPGWESGCRGARE